VIYVIGSIERNDVAAFFSKWMKGRFDVFLTGNFDEDTQRSILHIFEDKLEKPPIFNDLANGRDMHFNEHRFSRKIIARNFSYLKRRRT
jgi:hypothetical protein